MKKKRIQQRRRDRLFGDKRAVIRGYQAEDVRWLWVAARRAREDISQEEFHAAVSSILNQSNKLWIIEDVHSEFKEGHGPVGLIMATFDDWALSPHVEWFPWATIRNKLKGTVGFIQIMRYRKDVGIIKIFAAGEVNKKWFKWLRRYLPIAYAGAIPNGRAGEDEHIFYIRGRKHYDQSGPKPVRRQHSRKQVSATAAKQRKADIISDGNTEVPAGHTDPIHGSLNDISDTHVH